MTISRTTLTVEIVEEKSYIVVRTINRKRVKMMDADNESSILSALLSLKHGGNFAALNSTVNF